MKHDIPTEPAALGQEVVKIIYTDGTEKDIPRRKRASLSLPPAEYSPNVWAAPRRTCAQRMRKDRAQNAVYAIVTLAAFAAMGVMLAWRG